MLAHVAKCCYVGYVLLPRGNDGDDTQRLSLDVPFQSIRIGGGLGDILQAVLCDADQVFGSEQSTADLSGSLRDGPDISKSFSLGTRGSVWTWYVPSHLHGNLFRQNILETFEFDLKQQHKHVQVIQVHTVFKLHSPSISRRSESSRLSRPSSTTFVP